MITALIRANKYNNLFSSIALIIAMETERNINIFKENNIELWKILKCFKEWVKNSQNIFLLVFLFFNKKKIFLGRNANQNILEVRMLLELLDDYVNILAVILTSIAAASARFPAPIWRHFGFVDTARHQQSAEQKSVLSLVDPVV